MTNDTDSYLIVVDYEEDTERKRAEYLLDNWDDGQVESIRGLTRKVSNVEIDDLYDELVAKVPEEQITAFELTPVTSEATTTGEKLRVPVDTNPERAEWAMESVLNKRDAVEDTDVENKYAVYTKKGRATVEYDVLSGDGGNVLEISIEGYGEAAEFLREFFRDELEYML